jgi:hypothetical protein
MKTGPRSKALIGSNGLASLAIAAALALLSACGARRDAGNLPCAAILGVTPVVLQGNDSDEVDPAAQVVVDSRGHFFASSRAGARVLEWGSDGHFIREIGRSGDGPGELGQGSVVPFIAPGDTLFVRDNHMHWVVFDSSGRFIRQSPIGAAMAVSSTDLLFLPTGSILTSFVRPGQDTHNVAILNGLGETTRTFDAFRQDSQPPSPHPAVYVGEGHVWIGSTAGTSTDHGIQAWDTAGRLVDSVPLRLEHFQSAPTPEPGHQAQAFPYPYLTRLLTDGSGTILALIATPKSPDAAAKFFAAGPTAKVRDYLVLHVVALDRQTLKHLADTVWSYDPQVFSRPIAGTHFATRVLSDSTGVERLGISSWRLQGKPGASCPTRP